MKCVVRGGEEYQLMMGLTVRGGPHETEYLKLNSTTAEMFWISHHNHPLLTVFLFIAMRADNGVQKTVYRKSMIIYDETKYFS